VGYKEMCAFVRGEMSFAEAVAQIKQHTRNYAKRQLTWFGRDARVQWVELSGDTGLASAERTIEASLAALAEMGKFSS
jgi:tRNA dimethylallyltransferase